MDEGIGHSISAHQMYQYFSFFSSFLSQFKPYKNLYTTNNSKLLIVNDQWLAMQLGLSNVDFNIHLPLVILNLLFAFPLVIS